MAFKDKLHLQHILKKKPKDRNIKQSTIYDNNESDEFRQIKNEYESLKNEIKNLRGEMKIKDRSLKDYNNQLLTFETKYKELIQKHADQVEDLKQKHEELKQRRDADFEDLKQNYEELKQNYEDQSGNLEKLKQERDEKSHNFEELKQRRDADFEDLKQNYEELKQNYEDQSGNLEKLKQERDEQIHNFEELKQRRDADFEDLKQNYEKLKQNYEDQSGNLEKLKQERDEKSRNFEELKQKRDADFEDLKKNYEELKQKFADQSGNLEKLKQERDEKSRNFEELKKMHGEYNDQNKKFEELNRKYNELKQKHKDQNDNFEELIKNHKDQSLNFEKLKQQKEYFESHFNKSEQQLKEKNSQIKSLKQKNKDLEDEASKYQSALGIATSFDFSVNDQNNNVKLNQDILSLQDILENYVTNLKPNINVNTNEVNKLLLKYGCQSEISDEKPNKPLIKAVLQRYVLEIILSQVDHYFDFKNLKVSLKDHHLESEIADQTTTLTDLIEKFYNNRLGNDEITRITPIRLRQQVYTALGTRGFNNIRKADGEISKHNFIDIVSNIINKEINKYRIINDNEKKKYVNALAENLVRNVVRIFYFRLRIQEPMAQPHWFKNNEKIDSSCMKGSWDEDEVEDMVVEVCSFPLIYIPEGDGNKICTPAKVFPIHVKNQSLGERLVNFVNMGKSMISNNIKSFYSSNDDESDYDSDQSRQTILTEPDESNYHSSDKTVNEQVILC